MAIKYCDKSKKYTVSYSARHPITRRPHSVRRTGIKTKAEAKRIYVQIVYELRSKLDKEICPLWGELVNEFIDYCSKTDLTKATVSNRRLCLNAHTKMWDDRKLSEITSGEIRDLVSIKLQDRSPSQRKNVLKYIRMCFEYGVERGYIGRNPAPKMKFRIGDKVKNVLTKPQVEKFLNKAREIDSEWYPIWFMALYTGMRNGELYALSWEKVNLDVRTITVDTAWHRYHGFKSTKSGDDRIIEIAPNLLKLLSELKIKSFDSAFVLPRITSWDKGYQAHDLRMFLQGIGLPQIRFHDLRATWCTLMLQQGIEPIKVMKMGGWKNMATMERYVRQAGVDIKGITDKLDLHNHSPEADVIKFSLSE
jgi:integrase